MREIAKEIEDSIDMYFSQLRKEAENSWTNAYKKAEDFYCRFLNKTYGWDLYNRNYFKRNESDIDLATNDKSITVQVTAQNDNKKVKIENTISGFKKRKIKQGYKSLYIAFFEDLSKTDKETDFNDTEINFTIEKNILTPNSLKAHIQSQFTLQEQHELLKFLNQELFPLEQGIQSIATIQSIEAAFDREDEFYSNSKFLRNNWIILSKSEFQLFKNIRKNSTVSLYDGSQKYLLVGSSCSGKTTFAYFVANQLQKQTLVKSFYLKVTETLKISDIKKELAILNNQFSFLIIDDIQNNLDFSDELYVELKKFNHIQSIFLSRITSLIDDDFNGQIYQREFIWKKKYTKEIFCDNIRIQGLIKNRLNFYKKEFPDKEFEIGDFNKVAELVNFNLLKLSILLHFWGKEGGELASFNNDKLNDRFFFNYKFKDDEIQLTLRYASIYSFNIPFQQQLPFSDAGSQKVFNRLKDKGLFYKEDSYFVFHHSEFAELITQAIISQFPELRKKGIEKVKREQIIDYLTAIEILPDNFGTIIQNLTESGNDTLVEEILNTPSIYNSIFSFYKELNPLPFNFYNTIKKLTNLAENSLLRDLLKVNTFTKRLIEYYSSKSYSSQSELLKLIRENGQLDQNLKENFINEFQLKIPFQKIKTFEENGYYLKNEILAFKEKLGQKTDIQIGLPVDNVQIKSFVYDTPLNELTLTIFQDRKNQTLNIQRLSVLDFSFWIERFYSAPFFILGNCLAELKKTDIARQLASDIYRNLEVELLLKLALEDKNQPIKISKSLNELINFRAFDNNRKLDELLKKLIADSGFSHKITQLSLTDFARFLSDISDINMDVAKRIFTSRTSIDIVEQLLKNNETLYSITQIVNNLNKVSPEKSKEILQKLIQSDSFLSYEKLTDLNGLHEFKQCLKNYDLYLNQESVTTIDSSTIEALLNEPDLTKVAKTLPSFKKNKEVINAVFSSKQLSVANFVRLGQKEDFRISHLQQILPKLIDSDLELGHKIYTSLSDEYFIKPSNRTYFQGVCHAIHSFLKIDKQYSRKYQVASTKTQSILRTLCTNSSSTFLRKARNTEIDIFLNGYQQIWIISKEQTRQFLEPILIYKAKNSKRENISISTFGQGIKRLIDLDKNEYLPIAKQLFETYKPILKQTTKNLDIRKISYGLEQLSILSNEVDQFALEISDLIIDKCTIESKRQDFKTGALPELAKALKGKNGRKIIEKVTNL